MGLDSNRLACHKVFGELFGLLPIGLGLLGTVNAIEANLDVFVGVIQNRDGISIGYVNDFGVEVSGEDTA
jgi:hypothetical protein